MKLLPLFGIGSTFAFSKAENAYTLTTPGAGCLVCEYVNIAVNEDAAITALEDESSTIPCIAAITVLEILFPSFNFVILAWYPTGRCRGTCYS